MRIAEKLALRAENIYQARPVIIVCLGDSVTHGCFEFGYTRSGGIDTTYRADAAYPSLLERGLRLIYPSAAVSVINAGISGDNSSGGLKRLERDVLSFHPDLVTVNYGLNDVMNPDLDAGLGLYLSNMRQMFERITASGAEAMLVTPNAMCDYVSPYIEECMREVAESVARVYTCGALAQYVGATREMAREMSVPIADANSVWENMRASGVDTTALLANHINHPIGALHAIFANKIIEEIVKR